MALAAATIPSHELTANSDLRTVLGNRAGERLSREEIRRRVLQRAFNEPVFQRKLVAKSRSLFAVIYHQCLGIDRFMFMDTIMKYPVLFETRERRFMEVPSCHKGCLLPAAALRQPQPQAQPRSVCHLCEKAFPLPAGSAFEKPAPDATAALTRRKIEGLIQKRVTWDAEFSQSLHRDPIATYVSYARELLGGRLPAYLEGASELTLVHESGNEMYFIMPTRESFALEMDC